VARAPQERLTDRKCWRESAVCESKPDAKGQRLGDLGRRVGISAIERKSSPNAGMKFDPRLVCDAAAQDEEFAFRLIVTGSAMKVLKNDLLAKKDCCSRCGERIFALGIR